MKKIWNLKSLLIDIEIQHSQSVEDKGLMLNKIPEKLLAMISWNNLLRKLMSRLRKINLQIIVKLAVFLILWAIEAARKSHHQYILQDISRRIRRKNHLWPPALSTPKWNSPSPTNTPKIHKSTLKSKSRPQPLTSPPIPMTSTTTLSQKNIVNNTWRICMKRVLRRFKRIVIFLSLNIAIMLTINLAANLVNLIIQLMLIILVVITCSHSILLENYQVSMDLGCQVSFWKIRIKMSRISMFRFWINLLKIIKLKLIIILVRIISHRWEVGLNSTRKILTHTAPWIKISLFLLHHHITLPKHSNRFLHTLLNKIFQNTLHSILRKRCKKMTWSFVLQKY